MGDSRSLDWILVCEGFAAERSGSGGGDSRKRSRDEETPFFVCGSEWKLGGGEKEDFSEMRLPFKLSQRDGLVFLWDRDGPQRERL